MGQAKKKLRSCPALGRDISPADCGEQRHSRLACPEQCGFNPFARANYTALLEMEDRLDRATSDRLIREERDALEFISTAHRKSPAHGLHAATVWRLFFHRDQQGRTMAQRWADAGWPDAKNDQRILWRAKMQTRVALLEVRCILDDERVEVVDLLDPAQPRLMVVDRSLAATTARFSPLLGWIYPLPHFWRLSGTAIVLPEFGSIAPQEIVRACVTHLGGPWEPREARERWLAEHFARINEVLTATWHERRRRTFERMDAQSGAATYDLHAPLAKCRAALVADPAIEPDEPTAEERHDGFTEALVWLREPPSLATPQALGASVLGRVLLGADKARVEAMGAARLTELRDRFEARLGKRATFAKERRDNIGAQLAGKAAEEVDPALVAPPLLEDLEEWDLQSSQGPELPPGASPADQQAGLLQDYRRAWLDMHIETLENRTPREAAADPRLRPILIEMVKRQVRQLDEANLHSGRNDDINELIRALGLTEIDVPPPPPRAAIGEEGGGDGDDDGVAEWADDGLPAVDPNRPAAPRLTGPPLTLNEAIAAVDAVIRRFDSAGDAIEEWDVSGSTLLADMQELTTGLLNEEEFGLLAPILIQAWFALVPTGVRAPQLRYEAISDSMHESLAEFGGGAPSAAAFDAFTKAARQPHLFHVVMSSLVGGMEALRKKRRPPPETIITMLAVLKAVIDELDAALRR